MIANLAEIKNAMNQMQSKLDALMARVNEAKERISALEDGMVKEKVKMKRLKKIQSQECRLQITDSMKCSNVRIISIPEGVEKEVYKRYLNKL